MKIKELDCRFKADPADGLADGEFIAYPSTFTRTPDSYGDVVAPGAFLDSIKQWKESGNTLPVMYGHRMDDPDYNIGGVEDMGEDEHGWWIRGRFDMNSPKGPQVYRLVKEKRLSQLSFAFDVDDEGTVTLDDGTKANELRKVTVYEASFVPVGANQDTSVVAIKALCEPWLKAGRVLSAASVETLEGIADQLTTAAKQIKDFLASATADAETVKTQSDNAKASSEEAKNEEPLPAKSEEPNRHDSIAWKLAISNALTGRKETSNESL